MLKKLLYPIIFSLIFLSSLYAKNISIEGVPKDIEQSILENIENLDDNIKDEINKVLEIYGYYDSNITIKFKSDTTYIKIKLTKGIKIANINVSIIDNNIYKSITQSGKTELINSIATYKQNQSKIFNQVEYENFKNDLLDSAHNNGYLDAEYTLHKVVIDQEKKHANISLILDLKKVYYLNLIKVERKSQQSDYAVTNTSTNKFIFKFIPYRYNKLSDRQILVIDSIYNSNEILELKNSLANFYNEVNIKTNIDQLNQQVNLVISIIPIKNYLYSVGAGFSTDEGARAFGGLQIRNITSKSHKLDIKGKIAQYRELFETNYLMPGFSPATDLATIGYQFRSDKKRADNNLEKERHQIIGQYQKYLFAGNLQLTGGISYRREEYKDVINKKSRTSELFVPYFIYDQVLTDNRIKSNHGFHINMVLEAANDDILSDTSFVRLHTSAKGIIPVKLIDNIAGLRLITRGQFGQVWHKEETKIPPTLRFFAGGTNTVRGYRFESLGPKAINNKGERVIIGGDRLIALGAELEKTVFNNWSTAVFYDTGNAYDSWDDWSSKLQRGVGAGIRWQSPLGPLRLDVAQAIDRNSKPWRVDISLGPDL